MAENQRPLTTHEAIARINELAVEAAIHFNNAEIRINHFSGTALNVRDIGFRLRDGLTYRFEAMVYHVGLLHEAQAAAEQLLIDPAFLGNPRDVLRTAVRKQRFIFDDIVFNCVALFDYFGRFAGVLLQADPHLKLRWDRLYKWAKHPNAGGRTNYILGTNVASIVIREDQSWIKHLIEYRSRVIHYESEKPDGRVELRFTRNRDGNADVHHSLYPFVPKAFLAALKIRTSEERVPVLDAAHLLVLKVFDTMEALLVALAEDVEARVPEIPAGTVLTSPTFARRKPSVD